MKILLIVLVLCGCTTYNIDASIVRSFNTIEPTSKVVNIRDPNNPYKNIK